MLLKDSSWGYLEVGNVQKEMTWDEYLKWWKEHKNNEEVMAPEVIKLIARHHNIDLKEAKLCPRYILEDESTKIEFDLVIKYQVYQYRRPTERLLAIEFKETNFGKVIEQAMVRRKYVHYMYVAILPGTPDLDIPQFFVMLWFGIGLVFWDRMCAMLAIPAKYHYPTTWKLFEVLDTLAQVRLRSLVAAASPEEKEMLHEHVAKITEWIEEKKGRYLP